MGHVLDSKFLFLVKWNMYQIWILLTLKLLLIVFGILSQDLAEDRVWLL